MIEVFKTNVRDANHAMMLVGQINGTFEGYAANFDLEDCDNVLRVKSHVGSIDAASVINLVKDLGFNAEILPDTEPEVIPSVETLVN
jgi:hypothetical protein